jgi:hypothetical protein
VEFLVEYKEVLGIGTAGLAASAAWAAILNQRSLVIKEQDHKKVNKHRTALVIDLNSRKHPLPLGQELLSQDYKIKQIVARLQIPFDADQALEVEYGALFPRPAFEKDLAKLLSNKTYVVYHGPSELGKSTAIVHHKSIDGRRGVLYLSLRGAQDTIATRLAASLGLGQGS